MTGENNRLESIYVRLVTSISRRGSGQARPGEQVEFRRKGHIVISTIRSQITGFFRAFRSGTGHSPPTESTLLDAIEESTHASGSGMGGGVRAGTDEHHEIVANSHENYAKSFKKNGS